MPTRGTAATSNPVSELGKCCSALPSSSHGTAISKAVNATSGFQRRRTGPNPPDRTASGSSTRPPIPVRRNTNVPGDTSRTATRISR